MSEAAQAALTEEIRAAENQLLDPSVRASAEAMDRLVSDDFQELANTGRILTKADVVAQALRTPDVTVEVTDFRVRGLAPSVALATYRTARSLRSSIWRREGDQWRIVFHQGTPIPPTP